MNHRKLLRLTDYDYAQCGLYFVTICVSGRDSRLSAIEDGQIVLSSDGQVVDDMWLDLPARLSGVSLDMYVIMPNHVHGIIGLVGHVTVGAVNLGTVIRSFKSSATYAVNGKNRTPGAALWQPRFNDRIIRNEHELDRIRLYIEQNPGKWADDEENPARGR